jgi:hypothetical protein
MTVRDLFTHAGSLNEGLSRLNQQALPSSVDTPLGRAFKCQSEPHRGAIHTQLVAESPKSHYKIIDELRTKKTAGCIYAGAGGFVNLTYIAETKAGKGILFDINPAQTVFWNQIIRDLAAHQDRDGFVKAQKDMPRILREKLGDDHVRRFGTFNRLNATDYKNWFRRSGASPDNMWLDEQGGRYAHLHKMAREGNLGALTIDVLATDAWKQLQGYLKSEADGQKIDIMYLSNIPGFYTFNRTSDFTGRDIERGREKEQLFYNVGMCLHKKSMIIECDNLEQQYVCMSPVSREYLSEPAA